MKGINKVHLSFNAIEETFQEYLNEVFPNNTPIVEMLEANNYNKEIVIILKENSNENKKINLKELIDEIKSYSCVSSNEIKDPVADAYQNGYNSAIAQVVEDLEKKLK